MPNTQTKFMVLFNIPTHVMDNWMKTDPAERAAAEKEMMTQWATWTTQHADMILESVGAGKTKAITAGGVADYRNDIICYNIVQGASHEAVANLYKNHPHLGIPEASIQVMAVRAM